MPNANQFIDVYKRAVQVYAIDPSEEQNRLPFVIKLWLIVSISGAFLYGTGLFFYLFASIDKIQSPSPLLVWEIVAVTTTGLLLFSYFGDLLKQSKSSNAGFDHSMASVYIGISILLNVLFLVVAILFLTKILKVGGDVETHMCYLLSIVMSFFQFVVLDYYFAHNVRDFKKTREYMELLFFVDLPSAVAFLFLCSYSFIAYCFGDREFTHSLISGAVVMQMLLADILFVVVFSNVHWSVFRRLVHNCRQSP